MATERAIRAARLVQHERPLEVTEIPLEDPADDEVVVEMEFAAVNPLDRYHALGRVAPELPLPRTLGVEGVGRVNGRRIALHGYGLGAVRPGLWAEAAVVPKVAGVELPAGVDPRMAAAMGVAGTTAWRTVTEVAGVKAHDRVLVLGASGGVGTMTVSLVKSLGATVWGQTAHAAKVHAVERCGADHVLVSADPETLGAELADFSPTVVFDPLGDGYTAAAVEALALHGRIISFGTSADPVGELPLRTLYRKGASILGYGGLTESDEALQRGLAGAIAALAEGRMSVEIDEVIPLDAVNDALDRLAARAATGKIVLSVGSTAR